MIKYVAVLVLSAVLVQGRPDTSFLSDELLHAAAAGDWEAVQKQLSKSIGMNAAFQSISPANVKSLKPIPGGHVYGESEYTFHSATNINGQTSEQSGGHKIVNEDGKISEYDFTPTIRQ